MLKRFFTILAVTAVAAMAIVGCKKDKDNTDLNLEEKIIGKWMIADRDGQPMLTNKKMVVTFASATKAYMSESLNSIPEAGTPWNDKMEADVAIVGNKVTLTFHRNEHHTGVHEYIFTEINDREFIATQKTTSTVDGVVVHTFESTVRFVKQTVDYRTAILGKWECTELTGVETFNDANARLEFLADGTYNYWRKNDAG